MKKVLLVALFLFCFAGLASAEVIKFSQFSMDVPGGYTYEENEDGVFVNNKDFTALASIIIFPAADATPEQYAASFANEFGGGKPIKEGDGYVFTFEDEDYGNSIGMLVVEHKMGIFMSVLGDDMALMDMLGTIE